MNPTLRAKISLLAYLFMAQLLQKLSEFDWPIT
jgi:hypothetical protein